MINILNINKAALLAGLHNNTKAIGLGKFQDIGRDMLVTEAQDHIDDRGYGYDYLCGRPLKVDISGDKFDSRLYDRNAGERIGQKVVDNLIME